MQLLRILTIFTLLAFGRAFVESDVPTTPALSTEQEISLLVTGEAYECKDLSETCIHNDECCTECCRKGICGNDQWLGTCIIDCIKTSDSDRFTCSGDDECCSGICNSDNRCEEKTN